MPKTSGDGESLLDCKSFRFTPERLREAYRLVREAGDRREWRDDGCKQLIIRVGSRGAVFYRHGRDSSKRKLVKQRIGDLEGPNAIPLEAARKRCDSLRVDPKVASSLPRRRLSSSGPTIDSAWSGYIEAISTGLFAMRRQRKPLKASTIRAYKELFNAHLKPHASESLHWLAAHLKSMFETLGTRGSAKIKRPSPGSANKLLQVCKNLFEFCRDRGWWNEPNPALDPRTGRPYEKFALRKREVRLTREQTKRLVKAMEKKSDYWCDFFAIVALTGRRLSNVRKLRWDSIDLDEGLVFDSAEEMKNGDANTCALSKTALEILRRRQENAVDGAEWVFPGRKRGSPIVNPDHAWGEIRKAAKLSDLRIHDLRHNAASLATSAGHSQAAVGKFLSHRSPSSTSRYQHANVDDARKAAEAVDEAWNQFVAK
jgi:integrase